MDSKTKKMIRAKALDDYNKLMSGLYKDYRGMANADDIRLEVFQTISNHVVGKVRERLNRKVRPTTKTRKVIEDSLVVDLGI